MEPPAFPAAALLTVRAAPGSSSTLVLPTPSGTPPFDFEWSRAGASLDERFTTSTDAGGVRLTVSTSRCTDSGVYTLQASNAGGKDTARVRLEVAADEAPTGEDPPTFLRRLQDLTVKVGTRTRFLVEIVSSTECKVTWYRNERRLLEAERVSLVRDGHFWCADVAAVSVDDAGRWTCTAENAGGRASCSAHLNVLVPKAYKRPEFVEELRALLTEQGTVSLECKVVGVPTPVLRWFKDSREIKAGDVFALTANAEDPTSLGTYTCEAVNCMGRAYSSSKVHVVGRASREESAKPSSSITDPPPIFTKELEGQAVKICEPLALACQLVVPPWPKSVVWYNKEGKVEPGERYHVLEDGVGGYLVEVGSAEWGDDGEWKCVVTSSGGRVGISSAYVSVEVPKNYRKPRFMENLQAVLTEEGLVSFECKVVGFPTPVLSWFKDGQELKPGDVYQLTGTNSLGSYCCIARNCMGSASSSAELTVEDIQNQLNEEEKLQLFAKNQAPKFVHGLKSVEAKIDEPYRFTIKVQIPPEPSVLWYRDDQPMDDSVRCRLTKEDCGLFHLDITSLEFLDQAEWKCVATNDFGHSVTSCFLKLIIPRHYKKPRFLENLQAILSDEGAVHLECKVIGVPQPVLKWYKDGEELKPGDIHRIISGQDGTCCLGTYTCEAQNCMGIAASSASLLGFDESIKAKKKKAEEQALQRNLSLSTIHEERTSQMYDTPVGDITLDDKGEISFSFDGKEVSVSLYETPDLTEEEALQIVEMYADQLSENVTEHNVVELPPLRFVKETSTSGNLLMEAIIIDVSPEYFVAPEEDLRTEADIEDISIADENGPPQLSLDADIEGENYLEKTMALLSEERSDVPKAPFRKKSDSVKSGEDFYSLSRDPSISEDKKDDDTQVSESFASARSSAKAKSKSSKPSDDEFKDISDTLQIEPISEPPAIKERAHNHETELDQGHAIKPKRERRSSRGSRRSSSGSEKSISRSKDEPRRSKEKEESRRSREKEEPRRSKEKDVPQKTKQTEELLKKEEQIAELIKIKITEDEFKFKMTNISSVLSKIINEVQIIERDIILKSELMSSAATASRSLEIISNLISPLSEIHSIADAVNESEIESTEIMSNLFSSLPQPLKALQQTLTIIQKCIDLESESRTLIKKTCVAFIDACGSEMQMLVSELSAITNKDYLLIQKKIQTEINMLTKEISTVLKSSANTIKTKNLLSEAVEIKPEESSVETRHLRDTQKAVFELRSPLNSLLCIAESADSAKMVDVANVKYSEVILTDMSGSIQDLQAALEQIESLSVKESTTSLYKYNTEIIETVMESILKLRNSFEQLSIETKSEEDRAVLKQALALIKTNLSDISSHIDIIERNIGTFDVLQSENKLEVLQKMAQILIALENNLPILEVMPAVKVQMDTFHKNLTKVLENVIESNEAKKYFTLIEICDAVNRINSSVKNINVDNILSLASLGNTLKIIQDYFVKNVFEPELNCSILSNITDVLISIQEAINNAEEASINVDSEHIQEIPVTSFDTAKAKVILDHIERTIAAISNVKSMETTKELKTTIMPVFETIAPVLEALKQTIASARPCKVEQEEHVSEFFETSLDKTLATPICEFNQNIIVLNQMIVENLTSLQENNDVVSTIALPLHELHTTLEVLQQDVISQYDEDVTSYNISMNIASAVQNLQSCIVLVQEQAGVEAVDEMSTLEDISGIKTTADTIPSDRFVLPTAEETRVEQALDSLSLDQVGSATAQTLQSLNEHITVLQTPEVLDALDSLSEISDFSSLKSIALGLGELHVGIGEILHPMVIESSDEVNNLINTSKLTAIAEPMQELQQSLSILDMSNIPIYEHILELPTERLHSVLQTITEFKNQLDKCITAIFPAMETAEKTIEISNKVETLREICEHLKYVIKTTKIVTREVPVKYEILILEETVNNLLDATDVSKGIKIENVKAITEKLYESIVTVQEEIIQFTPQTKDKLFHEAQFIQAIDEIESNIAVLEQYEFVDLSRASDITSCTSPQLAMELDSESLLQMVDIVENAVNVVQDSTQDTPIADLMLIEDFFKTCKNEFTILRCLMTKQLSHKKIIRILQEFTSLQGNISDFRLKRSQLKLSEDIDSYLNTFLIHADDCLKNVQQSLLKIVQSQSEVLFKTPQEKLENSKETLKQISKSKLSLQIEAIANKFYEIIDVTKSCVSETEKAVIEELKDSSSSSCLVQENVLSDNFEEFATFVEELIGQTIDTEPNHVINSILNCIHKHEDYKDAVGTGKSLIIIKCLSECSDILQETILGIKTKPVQKEHKAEDSSLKVVLTEILEPLQVLHSQLLNVQEQILSGIEEESISVDIPSTESLVQTMTDIHKEIQQMESKTAAVNSEEISLIMEVDKEINSIQDSIRSIENLPAAQTVKEIIKPIEDIEKSLHGILTSDKVSDSKGKFSTDVNSNIDSLEHALKRFLSVKHDLLDFIKIGEIVDIQESIRLAMQLDNLIKLDSNKLENNKIKYMKNNTITALKSILSKFDWLNTEGYLEENNLKYSEKHKRIFLTMCQLLVELQNVTQTDTNEADEEQAKELILHIDQYIELIEVVEEISAIIKIETLKDTADVARELRESIAATEIAVDVKENKKPEIGISPQQACLAHKLQEAIIALNVQVIDSAQELAPTLETGVLQRIVQVTARLQADLVAVTGIQVIVQAPTEFVTEIIKTMGDLDTQVVVEAKEQLPTVETENASVDKIEITKEVIEKFAEDVHEETKQFDMEKIKDEILVKVSSTTEQLVTSETKETKTKRAEDVKKKPADEINSSLTDKPSNEVDLKTKELTASEDTSSLQMKHAALSVQPAALADRVAIVETLLHHIKEYVSEEFVAAIEKIPDAANIEVLKQSVQIAHDLHEHLTAIEIGAEGASNSELVITTLQEHAQLAFDLQNTIKVLDVVLLHSAKFTSQIGEDALEHIVGVVTQLKEDLQLIDSTNLILVHDVRTTKEKEQKSDDQLPGSKDLNISREEEFKQHKIIADERATIDENNLDDSSEAIEKNLEVEKVIDKQSVSLTEQVLEITETLPVDTVTETPVSELSSTMKEDLLDTKSIVSEQKVEPDVPETVTLSETIDAAELEQAVFSGILMQHIEEFISDEVLQAIDKLATPENVKELKSSVKMASELREKIACSQTGIKIEKETDFTREVQAEKAQMAQQLQTALSILQLVALESTFDPAPAINEYDLQHVLDVVTQLQDDLAIVAAIEQVIVHQAPADATTMEKAEKPQSLKTLTTVEAVRSTTTEKQTAMLEDETEIKYQLEAETAIKSTDLLLHYIQEYVSQETVQAIDNFAQVSNIKDLKQSIKVAQELLQSITCSIMEDCGDTSKEKIIKQTQLAQNLQKALSSFQVLVLENTTEINVIDERLQKVVKLVTHLQNELNLNLNVAACNVLQSTSIDTQLSVEENVVPESAVIQIDPVVEIMKVVDEENALHIVSVVQESEVRDIKEPVEMDSRRVATVAKNSLQINVKEKDLKTQNEFQVLHKLADEKKVEEVEQLIIVGKKVEDISTEEQLRTVLTDKVIRQSKDENEIVLEVAEGCIMQDRVGESVQRASVEKKVVLKIAENEDIMLNDKNDTLVHVHAEQKVEPTPSKIKLETMGQNILEETAKKTSGCSGQLVQVDVENNITNTLVQELDEPINERCIVEKEVVLEVIDKNNSKTSGKENTDELLMYSHVPETVEHASDEKKVLEIKGENHSKLIAEETFEEILMEEKLFESTEKTDSKITANKSTEETLIQTQAETIVVCDKNEIVEDITNDNILKEVAEATTEDPFVQAHTKILIIQAHLEKEVKKTMDLNVLKATTKEFTEETLEHANVGEFVLEGTIEKEIVPEITEENVLNVTADKRTEYALLKAHIKKLDVVQTSDEQDVILEIHKNKDLKAIDKDVTESTHENVHVEEIMMHVGPEREVIQEISDVRMSKAISEEVTESKEKYLQPSSEEWKFQELNKELMLRPLTEEILVLAADKDQIEQDSFQEKVVQTLFSADGKDRIVSNTEQYEKKSIEEKRQTIVSESNDLPEMITVEDKTKIIAPKLAVISEYAGLIQHIGEFVSEQTSGVVANLEQVKESVAIAKELRETIAVIETLAASEETFVVAKEARVEEGKLTQKLQAALSTLQTEVLDSASEIVPGIDSEALQRVSKAVIRLQEDLKIATISHISKDIKVEPEENSMKHLEELLQEVSDKINTTSMKKTAENTESLRDTLDEVQTVIIKLKRDCDGASNDTLNETLDDLECSVRSVQLQINEDSPPKLLKEACATLQLLANNMSETQEVHASESISKKVKSENVLEKCSQEANDTVKLLDAVSKINTKDLSQLKDIVACLNALKDALKLLRTSFSGDAQTLIEQGVDVVFSLSKIEDKVFSLEKDVENEKNLMPITKDNIITAVHSIYGSISNMRSTISSIQKHYMYESYGKPSESFLRSIKNITALSDFEDESINKLDWKKISKCLRTVLNHFEDIKFYVNLDKTARLPSDAAFTKVILEDLKLNVDEIITPITGNLSLSVAIQSREILKYLEFTLLGIETRSTLEVKEKVPIFKQLAAQFLCLTDLIKSELKSKEHGVTKEVKHETSVLEDIDRKDEQYDATSIIEVKQKAEIEPVPSTSKAKAEEIWKEIDDQEETKKEIGIKKRDSKKKREDERRKQEEQARINQEKEEADKLKLESQKQELKDKDDLYVVEEQKGEKEIHEAKIKLSGAVESKQKTEIKDNVDHKSQPQELIEKLVVERLEAETLQKVSVKIQSEQKPEGVEKTGKFVEPSGILDDTENLTDENSLEAKFLKAEVIEKQEDENIKIEKKGTEYENRKKDEENKLLETECCKNQEGATRIQEEIKTEENLLEKEDKQKKRDTKFKMEREDKENEEVSKIKEIKEDDKHDEKKEKILEKNASVDKEKQTVGKEAEEKRIKEEKRKEDEELEQLKADQDQKQDEVAKQEKEKQEKATKQAEEKIIKEEKRKEDEERKRLEADQKQKQEEVARLENEKQELAKKEAEMKINEEEKRKEEKKQLEADLKTKQKEAAKLEKEKREKATKEAENEIIEDKKRKEDEEQQKRLEADQNKKQDELARLENEKQTLAIKEAEKKIFDDEKRKKDEEQKQLEADQKQKLQEEAAKLEKATKEVENIKIEEKRNEDEEQKGLKADQKQKEEATRLKEEKQELAKIEIEKKRIEEEKRKEDEEIKQIEADQKKKQDEAARLEKEKQEKAIKEAEKKRIEEEKRKEDEEQTRLEADEKQKQEEAVKLEKGKQELAKKEAEKKRIEEEKRKEDEEKERLEADQKQNQEEAVKLEKENQEKAMKEVEKKRIEEEKRKEDEEIKQIEADQKKKRDEAARLEKEKQEKAIKAEKKIIEEEKRKEDEEQKRLEADEKQKQEEAVKLEKEKQELTKKEVERKGIEEKKRKEDEEIKQIEADQKKKQDEAATLEKEKQEKAIKEAEKKRIEEEKRKEDEEQKQLEADEKQKQEEAVKLEKEKQELAKKEAEKKRIEEEKRKENEEKKRLEADEKQKQEEAVKLEKEKQELAKKEAEKKIIEEEKRKDDEEIKQIEADQKKKQDKAATLEKETQEKAIKEAEKKRIEEEKRKEDEEQTRLEADEKQKQEEAVKLEKEKQELAKREAEKKRIEEEKRKEDEEKERLEADQKQSQEEAVKLEKENQEKAIKKAQKKIIEEEKRKEDEEQKRLEADEKQKQEEAVKLEKEKQELAKREAEKKRIEEEKRKEDEEQKRLEADQEQKQKEAARFVKEKQEKAIKEAENKRIEEEKRKENEEQKQADEKQKQEEAAKLEKEKQERVIKEVEKKKIEEEKRKENEEEKRLEADEEQKLEEAAKLGKEKQEKAAKEVEKKRIEEEIRKEDEENKQLEADQNKIEDEAASLEKKKLEKAIKKAEKKIIEEEKRKEDEKQKQLEADEKQKLEARLENEKQDLAEIEAKKKRIEEEKRKEDEDKKQLEAVKVQKQEEAARLAKEKKEIVTLEAENKRIEEEKRKEDEEQTRLEADQKQKQEEAVELEKENQEKAIKEVEKKRIGEEKRKADEEQKRLEADEKQKQEEAVKLEKEKQELAKKEAEKKIIEEEKRKEDEEKERLEADQKQKQEKEVELEKENQEKATKEAEKKRIGEEKRKTDEEQRRLEADEKRKQEEAVKLEEKKQELAKKEAEKKRIEEEKRKADEEAGKKRTEEEKRKENEEQKRLISEQKQKQENATKLVKEKQEIATIEAENKRIEEEKRKKDEERKRLEADQKQKQEEAARLEKEKQELAKKIAEMKIIEEEKRKEDVDKKRLETDQKQKQEKATKEKEEKDKIEKKKAEKLRKGQEKSKIDEKSKRLEEEKLKKEDAATLQKENGDKERQEVEKKKSQDESHYQFEREQKDEQLVSIQKKEPPDSLQKPTENGDQQLYLDRRTRHKFESSTTSRIKIRDEVNAELQSTDSMEQSRTFSSHERRIPREEYDSPITRRKYEDKERPSFVDHNHKDYTMEFARPTGYRERSFGDKAVFEQDSYGRSPTIYKAHSIVLDSQLRSSFPPPIDVTRRGESERRSEIRHKSKAVSEARSVLSEKRSSVPRDIKRKPVFSTYLTDRTAVEGSRVKLTCSVLSSSDPTITWYKNGVVLDNKLKYRTKFVDGLITLEVLNAVPSDSAEYSCTVENENGSVNSSANLKVYPSFEASPIPPTFTRSIRDTYHLAENELVLECRIRGQPLPTITWLKDDRPININDRYEAFYLADGVCRLAISHPTPEDSGKYTCKAENSVWSDQITHVVSFTGKESSLSPNIATIEKSRFNRQAMESRRPHFTNVLNDYKVVRGGTIGLQVEIRGSPTKVEWFREGQSVTESYRNARTFIEQDLYTLALSDVTEKEAGLYTCRAYSTHGTVDMNAAITVVQPNEMEGRPAVIVGRPEKDVLISVGEDLNISFRVQGEPRPKVIFMKGMRDITNSQRVCKMTSDDYVKFTVKRSVISDAGTYCILARNAYGCDRAFVTVVVRQRADSESLISDWTYPADDSVLSLADRQYKSVPERIPGEPSVVDGGSNWVSIAWPKPENRYAAPVLAYKVESWLHGREGGARWAELGITPLNNYDVFNLKQGEEYHFRITPKNRYGWGESVQTSNPISVGLGGDRPEFVEILPGQLKVLIGETVSLSCSVKGKPVPEVVWMKNGHELEDDARMRRSFNGFLARLRIEGIQVDDEGRYSCEASNAHGRASTYARLAVVSDRLVWEADAKLKRERSSDADGDYPPQFTMRLRDRRVQATYPVRLTCQVIGNPPPTLTWFKDGQTLSLDDRHTASQDEHFHTLEIERTTLEDGGVYEATVRNCRGAVSCHCCLVVDKGIRAYVAPEFCLGLEPLYRLHEGEELRITAVVEAYPSVGVTWYRDGVRLRPSRRAIMTLDHDGQIELALAAVTPRDAGVYTCTASNEVGRVTTSGKVEVIGDASSEKKKTPPMLISPELPYSKEPMFIRKPRSSEAREGDTVIIACEVIGDPKPDVYWLRDFLKPDYYRDATHFKRVGAGPEYRFEIPHAKLDYTGAYSVVARNVHGEAKAIISLQILARDPGSSEEHNVRYGRVDVIPRFERDLTDMLCHDGDAVEFECRVSGRPEPNIRWFHYNELIRDCDYLETSFDEGTARLRIKQVTAEDEGNYACEASNDLGKASSSACLVVYPPGEPNTLSQRLRRPPALLSAASTPRSTPRSTPARSLSRTRTPGPDPRRLCSPTRQMAPKFYTYPFNKVVEEGENVVFQCAVQGLPSPWATWDKDGVVVTPSARFTIKEKDDVLRILEIDEVTVDDVGVYRITLENDHGLVEASARLEVITRAGKFYAGVRAQSASPRRALRRRQASTSRQD